MQINDDQLAIQMKYGFLVVLAPKRALFKKVDVNQP